MMRIRLVEQLEVPYQNRFQKLQQELQKLRRQQLWRQQLINRRQSTQPQKSRPRKSRGSHS